MIGRACGSVAAVRGAAIEAVLPFARAGEGVRICARDAVVHAQVVAVHGDRATLAPFGAVRGLARGARVVADPGALRLPLGTALLGRALDARGVPLDGGTSARGRAVAVDEPAAAIAQRRPVRGPLWTGIRAIDGMLTIARGARIGIFGAPGAGKSSLLDAFARGADADAVVIALIGERGREAERRLAALNARTTLVCATADRSAAERVRAAEVAFAQAAALRARGLEVLLLVDSLARIGAAQRELAVSNGEAVGRGGYPASTFALLARLLERAGPDERGTVTLIATVLSDGADERDPLSDAARAALDGHLVLSERLAHAGWYPAIDVLRSASRTLREATGAQQRTDAALVRSALAALEESRDARAVGVPVTDPAVARALQALPDLERFLRQGDEPQEPAGTLSALRRLADTLG